MLKQIGRWMCVCVGAVLFSQTAFAGTPWDAAPMDWPHWRGPEMNGVSREKNIPTSWSPDGENLLWSKEEYRGRSTPIVMDGLLYMLVRDKAGTEEEGEKVVCLDAKTGDLKWENRFNVFLSDVPDTRVGWSCVVGDPVSKRVFALGVCGYFQCLDAKTGKVEWSHSLSEEYGLLSTYGGRTNMPIVYEDLVIISAVVIGWGDMAKPAHRFIAFDQRNGQPVWFNGTRLLPYDTTYSAPVLTSIAGEAAIVFGSGDGGVHAFQPSTGKNIWTYNVSTRGINTTPLVVGDRVICGHSEENRDTTKMGALFCLDASKGGDEIWRQTEWFVGKSAPIEVDGRVYACEDTGSLICADLATGKMIKQARLGGPMRSSPLYVDGHIFLMTENGRWWVFKPTKDGFETVERARLRVGNSYGSPIVSHGRMYIPTTEGLYCVGSKGTTADADKRPAPPKIADPGTQFTQVQVVPVESLLRPGQKVKLQTRLYDAKGQYLGLAEELNQKVTFSIQGVGEIKDGSYFTPTKSTTGAATITAKVGEVSGTARTRVIPDFPWKYDFDNGEVPEPWVGMRYRHIPVDYDLLTKLKKDSNLLGELYLAVQTSFVNSGRDAVKYDDSTARKTYTGFIDFLKLRQNGIDAANDAKTLDPMFAKLKEAGVISEWKWSQWKTPLGSGPELMVKKGKGGQAGNGVMMKISSIPLGKRSQGWIGHPDVSDYTIQADILGAEKDNKIPDIGLVAQRYTLDLMGASQQLQIRTWTPQLYMAQTVPFTWKPNVWYTMKFRTSVEGGKAVLRGKVWEKGQPEPDKWAVEAIDPNPNRNGSPGAFGNAKDAEIFYDNLQVTANKPNDT